MSESIKTDFSNKRFRYDNNVKAIISALIGAVSLLVLIIMAFPAMLLGLISLIAGITGLTEIKRTGQYGKGMAVTGIVLSSISFGLPMIVLLLTFII